MKGSCFMNINPTAQGQLETPLQWRETSHLRTRPIYKARAYHYPYLHPIPTPLQTSGLEPGTQARLIAAALRASEMGYSIDTLLTIRWHGLLNYDDLHKLRAMTTPEAIRYLVELVRKWLTRHGLPAFYVWTRELSETAGEHWHLALHLPKSKRKAFVRYLETVLVEPVAPCPRPQSKRTRGEFACSECASWHLAGDTLDGKPHFGGYWLAAYLGKGEPSQRVFRGKLVNNTLKPERGRDFGGTVKGSRYDTWQGDIVGTTTRKGRFDVARALK
jgi:hypothetical protein